MSALLDLIDRCAPLGYEVRILSKTRARRPDLRFAVEVHDPEASWVPLRCAFGSSVESAAKHVLEEMTSSRKEGR